MPTILREERYLKVEYESGKIIEYWLLFNGDELKGRNVSHALWKSMHAANYPFIISRTIETQVGAVTSEPIWTCETASKQYNTMLHWLNDKQAELNGGKLEVPPTWRTA